MCISLRAITSAVVDARIDGRTEAANRLTAAKIDAEMAYQMGPRPVEPRAPHAASSAGGYYTDRAENLDCDEPTEPTLWRRRPNPSRPPREGGRERKRERKR